jgi:hypothetical protein
MSRDKKRTPRNSTIKIRCTESLMQIINLQKETWFYKDFSIADIIHEAVAIKAQKEIAFSEKREQLYRNIIDSI